MVASRSTKLNFSDIKYCDLVNGTGIGISLFVSGCNINCPGCFNRRAQNFNFGNPFMEDTLNSLLRGGINKNVDHLSILGGEPLDEANYKDVLGIVRAWKSVHPNKPIWLWTGYSLSDIWERTWDIYEYLDYIIDGPYLRDLPTSKPFRGSDNQRLLKKVENISPLLATAKNKNQYLRIGNEYFIIVS